MKFVKQSIRHRQPRSSVTHPNPQNLPPGRTHSSSKPQPQPQLPSCPPAQPSPPSPKQQSPYIAQIITYLAHRSPPAPVSPDYFTSQPDITQHMRAVLLNWLIDVHLKYRLQPVTLFLGVAIVDLYLGKVEVRRNRLQLVGIVALWIAAKYEETYQVPKIGNLIYICDSTYTKQQILEMQANIIQHLDFGVLITTSLHYFQLLNQVWEFEGKDYYLCRYLLEIVMFQMRFLRYEAKIVACSVVYFVRKLRKNAVCWSERERELFGVEEGDLKQCAREVCLFWQKADTMDTMNSLKSKFQSSDFKEVSKIRIGQTIRPEPRFPLRA